MDKFWPGHPRPVSLLTDYFTNELDPNKVQIYSAPLSYRWPWCQIVANFAANCGKEPVLLFQEDFFLTAPVKTELVQHGLEELQKRDAGSVRLYPVPGGDIDYGDPYFALCAPKAPYRISAQATIWRPDFLYGITSQFNTIEEFEVRGNDRQLDRVVLAFKRDVQPWPLEYICSGVTKGQWNPDSKRLFEKHGIEADYSLRPIGR